MAATEIYGFLETVERVESLERRMWLMQVADVDCCCLNCLTYLPYRTISGIMASPWSGRILQNCALSLRRRDVGGLFADAR
jgi:hypothetical protein